MDLNTIAEELFSKIRGRFPGVTIGNEDGNVTTEPAEARYFEFTFDKTNDDKISVSLDEEDGVVVMFADDVTENEVAKGKWYNFLRELRMFSKKRMLNFDVRNITKSNLEKRDYQYLARNSGDSSMNESKLYGTSKLSYQNIDSARLVIKHTENIDTEVPSGRTRNIGTIYIESGEGERFKYPFKHLAGARAMARHVAEGGTTYDDFGSHIVDLSEELSKLRKFKNYMGRSKVMAESLADYMDVVHGRINEVKKRIDSLQKPNYYKEAYETFEKPVFEDIPEDVKENWIDQLTIRQFNEELKDVFPYIYKLIGEATRVKDLGPDDFMNEAAGCPCNVPAGGKCTCPKDCKDCNCNDSEDEVEEGFGDKVAKKFHKAMTWGDNSPEEMKKRIRNYSDEELKKLAKRAGEPDGGKGSARGLQMKLINQELKRRYGIKPGKDVSEDEDPCWDDYKQVGMKKKGGKKVPNCVPKEEMEIESYFNQLMGEWADEEVDEVTAREFGDKVENEVEKTKRKLKDLKQLKSEVWKDGDKDMLQQIQKKEVQLKQHLEKLTAEDAEGNGDAVTDKPDQQSPLSEFILSFYDRANGSFPKGETAVLTMVEKDYGEQYIEPAKQFIENINSTFEQYNTQQEGMFDRFKKKPKAKSTPLPTEPVTIQVGEHEVKLEPDDFEGYIGYTWYNQSGKEYYEETPVVTPRGPSRSDEVSTMEELIDIIKDEIEASEEGGKGADSHDEYRRLKQLAGL